MNAWYVGLLALLAEGLGLSFGIILLYVFKIKNKRLIGMLFGTTSGLMIALMCFDVLPEAMSLGRIDSVIVGVIIGVCIGLLLENIAHDFATFFDTSAHKHHVHSTHSPCGGMALDYTTTNKLTTTGIVFFMGIALHNIPEGFAMGTLALTSNDTITKLAFIIALHSIPEGIAFAIPLKASGIKLAPLLGMATFLGGIMGIGAVAGYALGNINQSIVTIMLGLGAGVILYIVCDELLPESRKIWNGRMTTVATIVGILLGMLLVH
ncbi:MAG: ZIP family metal transporter [Cellulosilyticaceae bacterium]